MRAPARRVVPGSGRRSIRIGSGRYRGRSSSAASCSDTARSGVSGGYPPRMARPDPDQPLGGAPDPWVGSEMPPRRAEPPFHMTEMIEAEPALAGRLLERLADPAGPAARLAHELRSAAELGRPILVVGCGTSEHGAIATVEILREALWAIGLSGSPGRTGTPVALQAFEASLEGELAGPGGVVIGISHEGGTWATNLALERARAARARVALVTVSDRSPGAALADIVVATEEMDESWCHTVGYSSPILAACAVAGHLTGRPILAARYAPTIDPTLTPAGRLIVPSSPGLPAAIGALLGSVVPLQLLAERLARARGVDPDPMRRDDPIYLRAANAAG